MTSGITVGQYLAVPYNPFVGNPARNETILDGCVNLPSLFSLPGSALERKIIAARVLTNPEHLVWEVWHDGHVCGILLLTRVSVGLDALAHFAFFDRQLLGRRALILTMMAWAFHELKLERLSVEIPEQLAPLIRFCRTRLGFSYEGEQRARANPLVTQLGTQYINGAPRWAAKWGSRREHMHFDGSVWRDVIVLRILREEFQALWEASMLGKDSREPLGEPLPAPCSAPSGPESGAGSAAS